MAHCVSAEAEAILDQAFPVLDKGFVRLVDYLGGDARVVQAARVSYGDGTKTFREDQALIDYLVRNEHWSPFEQVVLTFHIKLPLFVARQWIRHRTARVNEISGRYSVLKEEFYIPDLCDINAQSENNKQGRAESTHTLSGGGDDAAVRQKIREDFEKEQNDAYRAYRAKLETGVAKELARINLPLSFYTEWYWQIDLRNLFHFLRLRLSPHAQLEIRRYAEVLLDITRRTAPLSVLAFDRHIRGAVTFSSSEMDALRRMLSACPDSKERNAYLDGLSEKERARFEEKLKAPNTE